MRTENSKLYAHQQLSEYTCYWLAERGIHTVSDIERFAVWWRPTWWLAPQTVRSDLRLVLASLELSIALYVRH